jgi:hypothetical protein
MKPNPTKSTATRRTARAQSKTVGCVLHREQLLSDGVVATTADFSVFEQGLAATANRTFQAVTTRG